MTFATPHDLLVYLVELSDSGHASMLISGEQLLRKALKDGRLEWTTAELEEFARLLFALRDDSVIRFDDYAARGRRGDIVTYNDVHQAQRIAVTSHGRIAAATSRLPAPTTVTIGQVAFGNIANVNMSVLISAVEERLEEMEVDEETKEEARGRLHTMRDVAASAGGGAAGDLIGAALRQVLGMG